MTTPPGRSADSRRSSRSAAQWLLGLLIVLAIAASVLMVFTDRLSITGSLAVIAALWAAVIGAILVTKFRRQAESAEAKSRDLRLVYELQLEREIAARRQYELDVETTIRKEITAESNEELSELKAQVLALRSSLEMLLGEPLPDQRAALSNEKLRELASGLNSHTGFDAGSGFGGTDFSMSSYGPAYGDDGVLAARDFAATAPTADDGRHIGTAGPNEMTEVIPVITDDPISGRIATEVPLDEVHTPGATGGPTADPAAGVTDAEIADAEIADGTTDTGTPDTGTTDTGGPVHTDDTPTDEWAVQARPVESPAAENFAENRTETQTDDAPVQEQSASDEPSGDQPAEAPVPFAAAGRHEGVPSYGGGRRRRAADADGDAAHSAGLPVSELLNQLRAEAGTGGGGRRRRND